MCRVCVNISFQFLWVNIKACDCWIMRLEYKFCKKLPNCKAAVPFSVPPSDEWEFLLLHILTISVACVLDFGRSNRCVVVLKWSRTLWSLPPMSSACLLSVEKL